MSTRPDLKPNRLQTGYRLYLDTTGPVLSLALGYENNQASEQLLFTHQEPTENQRYHSAVMIPLIQKALDQPGITISDLTSAAINIGPGSFTGIRTGISTVRTLGQFLPVQINAFTQFELLACACSDSASGRPVAIFIDALRERAYSAELQYDNGIFKIIQAPALKNLTDIICQPDALILASPGLLTHPALMALCQSQAGNHHTLTTPTNFQAIPEYLDTPALMAKLLLENPTAYAQPWQDVLPLYLQEPNITPRKAQPGRMK